MKRFTLFVLFILLVATGITTAQNTEKPLILPFAEPPGPSTWLFGQAYGNTIGAYNFGVQWYSAGQGLHFGLDFPAPCGTPLVAVADADVIYVDNLAFGAGPHNLILRHNEAGITTLYGHMLEKSHLQPGQSIKQGDVVGQTGDPDLTCDSRPHLHLEVRSLDYRTAYNPVDYIDANWHSLALIGGYSYPLFQQDLENSRRWITLENQPDIAFGGYRLNNYTWTWPPGRGTQPPSNPLLIRSLDPIPADAEWQLRRIGYDNCCWTRWWHPTDPDTFYVIDGADSERAGIYRWSAKTGQPVDLVGTAPPPFYSPDYSHQISVANGQTSILRLDDGASWIVQTNGRVPALSSDNSRLMWVTRIGTTVPGQQRPLADIVVADNQGKNATVVFTGEGASARWIDNARLLITTHEGQKTAVTIYDTLNNSSYLLGEWTRLRNLSVSPGGKWLMFHISAQEESTNDGVYSVRIEPGAIAQKLPWFGAWRWRDMDSLYYVPYNPTSEIHQLIYYHLSTDEHRRLTDPAQLPFTIMNGDWSVSADGQHILFQNAVDQNMWLLEIANDN